MIGRLSRWLVYLGLLGVAWMMMLAFVLTYPCSLVLVVALAVKSFFWGNKGGLWAFGTAKWATFADLFRAGMVLGRRGMPIGLLAADAGRMPAGTALKALLTWPGYMSGEVTRLFLDATSGWKARQGTLVRLPNAVHTAIFAPPGAGKSTGFIIPHLLTCPESCVVIDIKGELAKATADYRRLRFGHECIFLDPFRVVTTRPDSLNPLDFILRDTPELLDACRDLAESLVVRTGQEREPHWLDSAEFIIRAILSYVAVFGPRGDRSLNTCRDVIGNPELLKAAIKALSMSDKFDGLLARLGHQLQHYQDKELSSTLTTTNRFLQFLDSAALQDCTETSNFDPARLKHGKMTVYLILPPHHLRAQSALLRMWISTLIRSTVREGLDESRKAHFILDEAAALGHLDCVADALAIGRGYGVMLTFAYQSMGQLHKCWPEGEAQTLLSATSAKIFFGTADPQTAEFVSSVLGDETILVHSWGANDGGSSPTGGMSAQQQHGSASWGSSSNTAQQARKLLKPEEVMQLPTQTCITIAQGAPPIRTTLVPYYADNGLYTGHSKPRPAPLLRAFGFMLCGLFGAFASSVWLYERENRAAEAAAMWAAPYPAYSPREGNSDAQRPQLGRTLRPGAEQQGPKRRGRPGPAAKPVSRTEAQGLPARPGDPGGRGRAGAAGGARPDGNGIGPVP
jgi:type IV secretion system protein VirD4